MTDIHNPDFINTANRLLEEEEDILMYIPQIGQNTNVNINNTEEIYEHNVLEETKEGIM